MKIANVLTASVLVAFGSLIASIGCSSPTQGPIGNEGGGVSGTAAPKAGDDDDNAKSAPPAKTTVPATKATTTTTTTTTDGGAAASTAACSTCISAASPKLVAEIKCENACGATDNNCVNNCWTTNCGNADTNECTQAQDSCATQCALTSTQLAACTTCLTGANSAKAAAYETCDSTNKCGPNDQNCDDGCWTSSGCSADENACDAALTTCDTQCNPPLNF